MKPLSMIFCLGLCATGLPVAAQTCSGAAPPDLSGISVAAPEMLQAPATAVECALTAQFVIERARRQAAMPTPAPVQGSAGVDPNTYVPKTQFDNTPWRFDMNQNGKRMTAEEFDAWMKAKGIRVAKGKPADAAPAATAPAPAQNAQGN
ncbi:hypothetical protein [Arenimonas sp.]|uniref:hypothetical protein n=1 Tax=Arenimonas sp. TaxID=1872635 RepID=UPI0039E43E31